MNDYTPIGKLLKSFGEDGGIRYSIYASFKEYFSRIDHIFILIEGIYVPFYLSKKTKGFKKTLYLDFVDNLKEADEISSKVIFVDSSSLPEMVDKSDNLEFSFLKGFIALDINEKRIGLIDDVLAYPMQEIALINTKDQILIPLHKSLIKDINRTEKIIIFDLPDGMLLI